MWLKVNFLQVLNLQSIQETSSDGGVSILDSEMEVSKVVKDIPKGIKNVFIECDWNELRCITSFGCKSGLPDFSCYDIPKRGEIEQMTTKYTKWP
jgi:hypothetical protein